MHVFAELQAATPECMLVSLAGGMVEVLHRFAATCIKSC